jgi:hypothetical protein
LNSKRSDKKAKSYARWREGSFDANLGICDRTGGSENGHLNQFAPRTRAPQSQFCNDLKELMQVIQGLLGSKKLEG